MRKSSPTIPQKNVSFGNLVEANPPGDSTINKPQTSTISGDLLVTVILESPNDNQYDNQQRLQTLKSVVLHLTTYYLNNGIVVFPGGMFYTGDNPPFSMYSQIEISFFDLRTTHDPNIARNSNLGSKWEYFL